jgi:hypothetical protein
MGGMREFRLREKAVLKRHLINDDVLNASPVRKTDGMTSITGPAWRKDRFNPPLGSIAG